MTVERFTFIAGPCVMESEEITLEIANALKEITTGMDIEFIFKASFDKANRTSLASFRGPGMGEGLRILSKVKEQVGVPVLTDIHESCQAKRVGEVVDVLQIPAFLCRQTDLLVAAAKTGKRINIKKGQFVAPADMQYTIDKVKESGNDQITLTERGSAFGYNNLVVDFRSFSIMKSLGYPVIFDATHSVQIPSQGGKSSGNREFVAPLVRAAVAYGIDGLFTEVYPEPDQAKCDGPNSIRLDSVKELLETILEIRQIVG